MIRSFFNSISLCAAPEFGISHNPLEGPVGSPVFVISTAAGLIMDFMIIASPGFPGDLNQKRSMPVSIILFSLMAGR